MSPRDTSSKITPEHLSRHAVVYLRQSSLAQVKQNTESRRLQYALTETARAYGFQRVQVIDRDLGMSAARPRAKALNNCWPVSPWARSASCSAGSCRGCHAPKRVHSDHLSTSL